ncbi:hypothetical protein [Sorangium sp. So ce381]|uniref:hypothetical protein n=1 Tax=Sorangium sp. So ce381 TaxID=3133307 RepID=UPI003F5C154C
MVDALALLEERRQLNNFPTCRIVRSAGQGQCWNDPSSCEGLSRQCYAEEQEYLRQYPPVASTIGGASPMPPRFVSSSPETLSERCAGGSVAGRGGAPVRARRW